MKASVHWLWLLLAFFVLTFPLLAQQQPKPEDVWQQMIDAGNDASDASNYTEAERDYRASLAWAQEHHLDASYLGTSEDRIAWSLRTQHRYSEAEPHAREGLRLRRSVLAEDDPDVIASKLNVGLTLSGQGQNDAAEKMFLEVLTDAEKKPKARACDLVSPLKVLTGFYQQTHQYQKGERIFTDAFALLTQNKSTPCEGYIELLNDMAELYSDGNMWDKVDKINDGRIDLAYTMKGPKSGLYGDTLTSKAESLLQRQKFADAATVYAQAAAVFKQLDPPELAKASAVLEREGICLDMLGKTEEAERVRQESAAAANQTPSQDVHAPMTHYRDLALEAMQEEKLDDAERYIELAIEAGKKIGPADEREALSAAGGIYSAEKKSDKAEAAYKRALEVTIASTGDKSAETGGAYFTLASFYHSGKRYAEAEESLEDALRRLDDPQTIQVAYLELTDVYLKDGKYEQAVQAAQRGRTYAQQRNDLQMESQMQTALGAIYRKQSRFPEAEAAYARGLELASKLVGPAKMTWATIAVAQAGLYRQTNRLQQAEQMYIRVISFTEQQMGRDAAWLRIPLNALIETLKSEGKTSEAATYQQRRDQLPQLPEWLRNREE